MVSSRMVFLARDLLRARVIPWVQSEQFQAVHCPMTCFSQLTKRRIKPNSKVSSRRRFFLPVPNNLLEAALDANAPLEDEEAANGPVDSDEELTSVMHGLSNWNPQPIVPPLIHIPIERTYQKQRLYEQLHNATNGFTVNIFKVNGYGRQRLPPDHPVNMLNGANGDGDAEGEAENPGINLGAGMATIASRRANGINLTMPPQRRPSGNNPIIPR